MQTQMRRPFERFISSLIVVALLVGAVPTVNASPVANTRQPQPQAVVERAETINTLFSLGHSGRLLPAPIYLPVFYKSATEPAAKAITQPATSIQAAQAAAASGPLFIENVGQFDPQARFLVRGGQGNLFLADDALWLSFVEQVQEPVTPTLALEAKQAPGQEKARKGVNLKLSFTGANPHPRLEPFNRLDTHVSYFIGDDPAKWRADVPVWGGVRYVDLYPGIDLEMTNEQGQLQQRLVVRDSTQLPQVRLKVDGAQTVSTRRLQNRAALQLNTAIGEVSVPLFEVTGTAENNLSVPTIQDNSVTAPFSNAPMRAPGLQSPLWNGLTSPFAITNTSELLYSTFLGGSSDDVANGIAVDKYGAIYVAGCTYSSDFITTTGSYVIGYNGVLTTTSNYCGDAFISKINTTGEITLTYSTFLGTSSDDGAYSIAVNANGEAYVTGFTSGINFPVTNAYSTSVSGGAVFVTKFNITGTALLYSSYLGQGQGSGIAVDFNGNAAVTGSTNSRTFPTTPSAFQGNLAIGNNGARFDAFISLLDPSLSGSASLVYSMTCSLF
jgi:hypothetical protein